MPGPEGREGPGGGEERFPRAPHTCPGGRLPGPPLEEPVCGESGAEAALPALSGSLPQETAGPGSGPRPWSRESLAVPCSCAVTSESSKEHKSHGAVRGYRLQRGRVGQTLRMGDARVPAPSAVAGLWLWHCECGLVSQAPQQPPPLAWGLGSHCPPPLLAHARHRCPSVSALGSPLCPRPHGCFPAVPVTDTPSFQPQDWGAEGEGGSPPGPWAQPPHAGPRGCLALAPCAWHARESPGWTPTRTAGPAGLLQEKAP